MLLAKTMNYIGRRFALTGMRAGLAGGAQKDDSDTGRRKRQLVLGHCLAT